KRKAVQSERKGIKKRKFFLIVFSELLPALSKNRGIFKLVCLCCLDSMWQFVISRLNKLNQ
ncbi:MAG: hypothetical protein PUE17_07655, partial [Bacteroidales bacterium]|nr:hypothetical protein [Bacteroidales bacterium]